MFDVQKFIDGVHDYIARALTPLAQRIKALEERPAPEDGKDGESVTVDQVRSLVREALATLPTPENGKDVDPETVRALVAEAVKGLPAPKDGESVTLDQVLPILRDDLQKAIDALPIPKNGEDATPVTVEDFRSMFETEQAKWALDFERRAQDLLQRAVDRIPPPKDGVDGVGFDDLTVDDDGAGTATIKFTRGEVVKEFAIRLPRIVDKGVYKPESEYAKGDGVSWGGSFFIAQCDEPQGKPEDTSKDWRLAVKRGRAGKDGDPGKDFTPPKPVKL